MDRRRPIILLALFFLSSPVTSASLPKHQLRSELTSRSHSLASGAFGALISQWESQYGTEAFEPLLELAKDAHLSDQKRYVALLAAAKIGGQAAAPHFLSFLKDRSWMIRSATLKALTALENPATAEATVPLLFDKALVVRLQAIDTVRQLKPKSAQKALLSMLKRTENYHAGKALWAPNRALKALETLGSKTAIPDLRRLLVQRHSFKDELFKQNVRQTITALTQ